MKFVCNKKDVAIENINDSEMSVEINNADILTTLMLDPLFQEFLNDPSTLKFLMKAVKSSKENNKA
jgi:hypothetical protein